MKEVAVTLYELRPTEVRRLPKWFPVLEYDTLFEELRITKAGKRIKRDNRYVYLIYKEPPKPYIFEKETAGVQ